MIASALSIVLAASPASQAWKASAGDWSGNTPHVAAAGDNVLFDTYQDLRLVRATDGKQVKKIAKGPCFGAVIDLKVDSDLALVLCESPHGEGASARDLHSTLAAIDLKTGKPRWSREGAISAPIALEGALVVFADAGKVIAVDLTMGKPVWSAKTINTRSGVSGSGKLAAIVSETSVQAISESDGSVKWTAPVAGIPHAAPLATADAVFVVHDPGSGDAKKLKAQGHRLSAFAAADGKVLWQHDFKGESLFFQPVLAGDRVMVVGMGEEVSDGHLWALNKSTGALAWSVPWAADANGHDFRPVEVGDVMVTWAAVTRPIGAYELVAFDPSSGAVKWTFAPTTDEKFVFSRPLSIASKIVYGDGDTVRALKLTAPK